MNRLSFATIVFLVAFDLCCAQELYHEANGQIAYDDKTVNVRFRIPVVGDDPAIEELQNNVWYFDEGEQLKKLRPSGAKEIRIDWQGEKFRMISHRPGHHTHKKKFVLLAVDGNVKLFEYVKTYTTRVSLSSPSRPANPSPGSPTARRIRHENTTMIYFFLQRNDGEKLVIPRAIGFRKQMRRYFKDC